MTKSKNTEHIRTLDFINGFIIEEGYSPCLDEIAKGTGISLGTANRHVKTLQDKFLLVMKEHTKRSMRVTEKGKEILEALR